VHWLMQEPELEEESLTAVTDRDQLVIQRRSLNPTVPTATVTAPDGTDQQIELLPVEPGLFEARIPTSQPGLYKITQGEQQTLGIAGALDPPELRDLRGSPEALTNLIDASGGGLFRLEDGSPGLRMVDSDRVTAGQNWYALQRNGEFRVLEIESRALMPPWLALVLGLGLAGGAWWRESL